MNFDYEFDKESVYNGWKKFVHPHDPDIFTFPVDDEAFFIGGWNSCKEKVLQILKHNWQGADLSINSCDEYYIKKIEELL